VPTIRATLGKVLDANQPWEASSKEKLREYGLLIRGSYDHLHSSSEDFARLIKGVLQGNKTLLAALNCALA
jgi:hypothetical protein